MKTKQRSQFFKLWLIIGIIAGLAVTIFFIISYLDKNVFCDFDCSHKNKVILSLLFSALAGLFAGSLTYYFMSEKKEREINQISHDFHRDMKSALKFLEPDYRKVIQILIKNKGSMFQSKLSSESGLSRVSISRMLSVLEKKEIVHKKQSGMTNEIFLSNDLKEIFCDLDIDKKN